MRGRRCKRKVCAATVDLDLMPAPLPRTLLAVAAVCLLFSSGTAAPSPVWENPSFIEADTAGSPGVDSTATSGATAILADPPSPEVAAAVSGGVTPSRAAGDGTVAQRETSGRNLRQHGGSIGAANGRYRRAAQETDR